MNDLRKQTRSVWCYTCYQIEYPKTALNVLIQHFPLHSGVNWAGSWPKQLATGQSLAGYFCLTLVLILVRNLQ